ncbi:hypothetical protein ACFYYY_00430 [Streptomyces sp. NPDC001834]|uniref:hypothetical protein n=1 Tax=unclassified Streptomyces TaxID=2593676 RepID=UPI0034169EED
MYANPASMGCRALHQLTDTGWRVSENDVLSPYGKPRLPGMLAFRLHRELRGVTAVHLP